MVTRKDLHNELKEVLGSNNVYFQPPESITLSYPCIIYSRDKSDDRKADNYLYLHRNGYNVMIITRDPESDIGFKLMKHFMLCSFNRNYISDKLYHEVYTIYY